MRTPDIIATLGPSSESPQVLAALMHAGMTTARINCSHASPDDIRRLVTLIRKVAAKQKKKTQILLDLQGPKMRLGKLISDLPVTARGKLTLVAEEYAEPGYIPVQYAHITQDAKKGDHILIGDGQVELEVDKKRGNFLDVHVIHGGIIKSHQGITLPNSYKPHEERITQKDYKDALLGAKLGVDSIALSFVQEANDIRVMQDFLRRAGSSARIIAKIEHPRAMDNIAKIAREVDGLMVARGDLALQISFPALFPAQELIVAAAKKAKKYCIIATQALESMVESPLPTRAEVIDVAYSARLGVDALMLSNETAVGRFPVIAVRLMREIAEGALKSAKKPSA